jgi:hypothetical protein
LWTFILEYLLPTGVQREHFIEMYKQWTEVEENEDEDDEEEEESSD